jgi:hypothetical protein
MPCSARLWKRCIVTRHPHCNWSAHVDAPRQPHESHVCVPLVLVVVGDNNFVTPNRISQNYIKTNAYHVETIKRANKRVERHVRYSIISADNIILLFIIIIIIAIIIIIITPSPTSLSSSSLLLLQSCETEISHSLLLAQDGPYIL